MADNATPSVTVTNVAPVASSVVTNSGGTITLTEYTTTSVVVTAVVTDTNGCQDLTSVKVALYKQGTTCTSAGNADNDLCYFWEDSAPASDLSCTGPTDKTYALSKSFSVQYYADGGTWVSTVTPADEGAGTPDSATGVTLSDLNSLDVSATISFGDVAPGEDSDSGPDHTATVTNTGNIAMDLDVSGGALTCSSRGSVAVNYQEYSLSSFSYGSGTDLSASPAEINGDFPAPEDGNVPVTDLTYWEVYIPDSDPIEGTCTGTTTFAPKTAV